jgi:hypothetical protein
MTAKSTNPTPSVEGRERLFPRLTPAQLDRLLAHGQTHPDLDRDPSALEVLDRFDVSLDEVPIVFFPGSRLLRNPSNGELADCLGFNEMIDDTRVRDLLESQLCGSDDVVVVGRGNSAGQAAVFLSGTARHVHVIVRAPRLADSMSRYLIRRIEEPEHHAAHAVRDPRARGQRPSRAADVAGRAIG